VASSALQKSGRKAEGEEDDEAVENFRWADRLRCSGTCRLAQISRSLYAYRSCGPTQEALRKRMCDRVHPGVTGKLRDECLNADQFLSIEDARSKIEAAGRLQPASTPSSLGQLRLREFLKRSEVEEDGASFLPV